MDGLPIIQSTRYRALCTVFVFVFIDMNAHWSRT
jgi:hypothetical protein